MKLFQRIFATFCAVIICAIFVASFSFWLVQQSQAENHFNQQRAIDEILLANAVSAFRVRGEAGAREMLQGWHEGQGPEKILIITGDEQSDLLGRKVDAKRIEKAREYALENPDSKSVHLEYGRWGEEYLFFIRNWDSTEIQRRPSPLYIPGLPLEQTWHEIIILGFIFLVGLALAYVLAHNITATTNSPSWPSSSTKWRNNCNSWWPKSGIYCTMFRTKCVRRWRVCRRLSA